MQEFFELLRKVTSSPYHDRMIQSVAPLKDALRIHHFWYYHVSETGFYTYIGTHAEWSAFCFENHLIDQFPCLRNPKSMQTSTQLMKSMMNASSKKVLDAAWEKFHINFNVNLLTRTHDGVEAFGFATDSNHPKMDEIIINEVPLLKLFAKSFRINNKKIFDTAFENQVNIASYLGPKFDEITPNEFFNRTKLIEKLGLAPSLDLTKREKELLSYLSCGFSSPYIADQLKLSCRTVENYIDTIKGKLFCGSKSELILKAKELFEIGYTR